MIAIETIKIIDFSAIEGYRNSETQNKLFEEGKSKLKWPLSQHNKLPSMAFDIVPYPIDWTNLKSFYFLAGIIKATAFQLLKKKIITHGIRWGGDWNGNNIFTDQTFDDLPHFELVKID